MIITMKDILFSILIWRIKYFERSQSKIMIVWILNSMILSDSWRRIDKLFS